MTFCYARKMWMKNFLGDLLHRAGSIAAAAQIAKRMLNEARQSLEAVPANRYVNGLQQSPII